jgi:hypothetical protein
MSNSYDVIKNIKKGDSVYLKTLNIPGFVCNKGYKCIFDHFEADDVLICTLLGSPSIYGDKIPTIKVKPNHVLSIYDQNTQEPIYLHNISDGL